MFALNRSAIDRRVSPFCARTVLTLDLSCFVDWVEDWRECRRCWGRAAVVINRKPAITTTLRQVLRITRVLAVVNTTR